MTTYPDTPLTRRRTVLTAAGLVALVMITAWVYRPALEGDFIWDDDLYVAHNPLVQQADGLQRIWFSTESRDYYPLTLSLFWLEWRGWGAEVTGYHVVNLALHIANALLLWLVLRRLAVPGAWVAALLFAVHPVNVPSVAWICELKNLLALLFCLGSLLCYLEFERDENPWWYGLALGFFLLALLSKTAVVTWPAVLLGHAWWARGRCRARDWWRVAPFLALSLALGLVTVWFQHHRALEGVTIQTNGFWERSAGAGWAVWFYLTKALFPWRLSMVYEPWALNPALRFGLLPAGLLVAGAWLLWRANRPWTRALLFGLGCYVALLLPMLGFIDQGYYSFSLVADHWQYFALPAICALVGGGVARLAAISQRRRVVVLAATAGVGLLCLQTMHRSEKFVSDEALWWDTVAKSPGAWLAHLNLANDLARRGADGLAAQQYWLALKLNPQSADAHYNFATVLARHGKLREATVQLATACRIHAADVTWLQKLAALLAQQKEFAKAAVYLADVVRLAPDRASAHYDFGCTLEQLGRWPEAETEFAAAARLTPASADAHYALSRALLHAGQTNAALEQYRAGMRYAPHSPQAGPTLTNLLAAGQQP